MPSVSTEWTTSSEIHHIGVRYGTYDHYRLIDTLRILPSPTADPRTRAAEPVLGMEEGGIQSAEALLWARYLMYSQVYYHQVNVVYDVHLRDFMKAWLPGGLFSTDVRELLNHTDNDVMSELLKAAQDSHLAGHEPARRIVNREHFRELYRRNPIDIVVNPDAAKLVAAAATTRYGAANIRYEGDQIGAGGVDFPVLLRDGRLASSLQISEALVHIPAAKFEYVFIPRELRDEARTWLRTNVGTVVQPPRE